MTYLDSFIDFLLKDKQFAYELFANIYWNDGFGVIFFNDNIRKIAFHKNYIKYNDDKDEEILNNLCDLFKNEINYLIKNHISYNYVKNDCINILEDKLFPFNTLNKIDIRILNIHWVLNNIDVNLENYIKQYFKDQSIKEITVGFGL